MRRARAWSLHLAVVGLSLTWFGCGGSVPDPASDTAAAPEAVPPADGVVSAKASPDAETVAKGDETEAPAAAPASATPAAVKPAPAKGETTAAEEPAAPAAKGDASGTAELLNLANTSAAPADVAKADAATKGESAAPGGGPGMQASMRPGGMPAGYPGAPGAPGGANPAMSPNGMPNMPGMPGMPGMPPGPGAGYPGGLEGSGAMPGGGGGNDNGPPSFQDPIRATVAFLKAVNAKDRDRIVEATALRAGQAQETGTETMRKLFATILDQSISDESLNDLFKALDGYQIVDTNIPKSTGRFGVILGKSNHKAGQYRRTITLRKEAKGWKVVDIGGQAELEATIMPSNRANGRMPAGKRR